MLLKNSQKYLYLHVAFSKLSTMLIDFNSLPTHARAWLYCIPRPLSDDEVQIVTKVLENFCTHWEAHKEPLETSFQILHKQFIILAVDESIHGASGCSIDSSVKVIRELGTMLQADLFDRQFAAYWQAGKLEIVPLNVFKTLNISGETFVFDQTFTTIGELKKREHINITETWLKRYLPVAI